jgi:NitT/TauT family transport system substrate-binding protein
MKRLELLCAAAGVAFAGGGQPAGAQEPAHFIGASTPIEGDALMFLAQSQGYFARNGLNIDVNPMNSGEATASAVIAGDIAIGSMNTVSLAIAHQNGIPLKMIAPGAQYDSKLSHGTQFMVRKDSSITSGAGLNGKTVAVNVLRGTAHLAGQAWIQKHGGDPKTVRWIESPFALMPAAIEAGRVDAAVISEPAATRAQATCKSLGAANDAIAPVWLISMYVSTASWIAAHPDATRRIRAALKQTAVWYDTNHEASIPAVAALTKQEPEMIAKSVRSIYGVNADPALIQPVIEVAALYGVLKATFPAGELIANV